MKIFSNKLKLAIFTASLLLLFSELKAQTQISAGQAVDAAAARSLETRIRSSELERVKKEADKEIIQREPIRRFPEIKEDFERIQTVNLDMLQNNIVKPAPNYKIINKAAIEIRRRGDRLRKTLFPQTPPKTEKEAEKKPEKNVETDLSKLELKPLSIALDNAIYRFTSNKIFQNTNVVSPEDSIGAQIELNKIIKISSLIENKSKLNF